jgi:transposase InsO family protein
LHSDRSSQSASYDFNQVLREHAIRLSMSGKGYFWDSACSETLFRSLKLEGLQGRRFETFCQTRDETIAWLLWYNQTRMH